jgi:hypothetical protein
MRLKERLIRNKWSLLFYTLQLGWCVWIISVALAWYLDEKSALNFSGVAISLMLLAYWAWCVYRALRPKKPVEPKELDYVLVQKEDGKWWVGYKNGIAAYGPFDVRGNAYEFIIEDIKKEMKK